MIRTQTQVPSVYYIRSRDFQLIGRLYDLVFNSSKSFADGVFETAVGTGGDANVLDLLAKTLGFEVPRKYDISDLSSLCESFKSIVRNKGSKKAIEDCVKMMLYSQNINDNFDVDVINVYTDGDGNKQSVYKIQITIPQQMKDLALLEDMLEYVIPVGYRYEILTANIFNDVYGEVDATVSGSYVKNTYTDDKLGNVMAADTDDAVSTMFATSTVYDKESTTNG